MLAPLAGQRARDVYFRSIGPLGDSVARRSQPDDVELDDLSTLQIGVRS